MAIGVKLVSNEEASPEVKQLFEQIEKQMGFIPPTMRAMANKPEYLKLFLEKSRVVMGSGKIDGKTKLFVALTVSILNNCEMCITTYTNKLKEAGVTDDEIVELLSVIDLVGGLNHFNNGLMIKPSEK
ncbi:carboxymuconolactone decarboxylase family protein [Thermoanaerobacterium thermosaccharolyticum]|uniref:carboxymuconolactone decarboxylase family protein n=1 Tax=Thermoanaerobacterium thermosaccharolyticum TaxID=1517 RepID=UPI00104CFEF3|nr:carboxymuconolactone decarboxylase family protein [Thermoanaerobacterium thermosaccharolyticum]MBE0069293.1 carboxymuconolactone decarboxylase family protein [Thermoanaerobacterium thermosaccharolyticum]MBE0229079.1 carboxymuconolactone decarboxylase family protein [Thermoanaerobacterium thermosaccharolyticum]MCP2239515.1 AhpD family alkylhydroperoxidase [Thermoanaerobacterium thermosaccharolyticum]TCW34442.1 AhpD family alkylhydroperoxidase [Thermohydrogenium kirishiense]